MRIQDKFNPIPQDREIRWRTNQEPMTNFKAFIHVATFAVVIALIIPWWMVFMDSVLEAYTGYARWVKWVAK